MGVCRYPQVRDLLGSRHHQSPVDIWGQTLLLFSEFSLTSDFSPRVLQPSLNLAPTVDDINVSQREIYDTLSGVRTSVSAQRLGQGNWVHIAVAAEAHVRATRAAAAGGHRIIVRSGPFFYQDIRKFHIPSCLAYDDPTDIARKTS